MKDLDQKIPSFPNCDNYRIRRASNPNPLNDDTKTNDNELNKHLCVMFKIDYLQEMDIITKIKARLECKINVTLPALLPNKIVQDSKGPANSSDKTGHEECSTRSKRAIPLLAVAARSFLPNYARFSYLFLLELCINVYCVTLGNVARVYPWIVQGLTFLSA